MKKETNNRPGKRDTYNGRPLNNGQEKKKKHKKKRSRVKRVMLWTFLIVFLFGSLSALGVVITFNYKYGKIIKGYEADAQKLVSESTPETFRQAETSLVYDSDKNLISVLKGEKDLYYLTYDEIPEYAKLAMISIEDKKFLTHEGIDLKANFRAMIAYVKNRGKITQGASTITQQLARGIFLTNEVSWERKFREICLAIELEKKYTKKQILEFYLNNIYFANGYYGIEAASKGYFNKDVGDLSLSQIAYICAIPNNPTLYNPFEHPENTVKRRDRILYQMYQDKEISLEQYNTAKDETMKLEQVKVSKNNYVETYVYYCATRALMEQQGFEFRNEFKNDADKEKYDEQYSELYNECQKSLYYKGYRIYTSIDMNKQNLLQESVNNALKDYTKKNDEGTYTFQGAAVSIDNSTGRIVAIVGGRYQEFTGYTLNRAYQSYRQPGSSIKPLIVYTPSFERGYTPDTIVVDQKIKDGPSNSSGTFRGKLKLRRAVELSINTIAWQLFTKLTPKVGLSYLLDMNFSKIDKNDYYPAASLGGLTNGASPLEMTAAYATLENSGIYREPTCIDKITDSDGNVIVSGTTVKKRIYQTNAARMMTDVLKGVITNGTGKGLGLDNMVSAGKTGTTSDKKDGWFVGYTPYYTTGVWVGYDIPKATEELSGATFPGSIWHNYMNEIHKGLKNKAFEPYENTPSLQDTKEEETTQETETVDTQETTGESTDKGNSTGDTQSQDTIQDSGDSDETGAGWNDNTGSDFDTSDTDSGNDTENSQPEGSTDDTWSQGSNWNTTQEGQ